LLEKRSIKQSDFTLSNKCCQLSGLFSNSSKESRLN